MPAINLGKRGKSFEESVSAPVTGVLGCPYIRGSCQPLCQSVTLLGMSLPYATFRCQWLTRQSSLVRLCQYCHYNESLTYDQTKKRQTGNMLKRKTCMWRPIIDIRCLRRSLSDWAGAKQTERIEKISQKLFYTQKPEFWKKISIVEGILKKSHLNLSFLKYHFPAEDMFILQNICTGLDKAIGFYTEII